MDNQPSPATPVVVVEQPKPKSTEIQAVPEQSLKMFDAEVLISQAISANVSVDTMERLLGMRRELKAEWAKEQYTKAMSAFQGECPTIKKTKSVNTNSGQEAYKYAPLDSIVDQVKAILAKHGFSYSTTVEVLPAGVKAVVKVTHINGHSEDSPMEVPLGNKTQIMSASQVTAAASTFAKRYAFCNAFGILTGDEDNDGKDMGPKTTKPAQTTTTPVQRPPAPATTPARAAEIMNGPGGEERGLSKAQGDTILRLLADKGIKESNFAFPGGISKPLRELSMIQASAVIKKLLATPKVDSKKV